MLLNIHTTSISLSSVILFDTSHVSDMYIGCDVQNLPKVAKQDVIIVAFSEISFIHNYALNIMFSFFFKSKIEFNRFPSRCV